MATWVTHFRIAEELLKQDLSVSVIDFLVGNIGADCGLIGEDGKPNPPKEITHFVVDGKINSNSFYNEYFRDENDRISPRFSYYLGYYIHLFTDEEWIKFTDQKQEEEVYQEIIDTPDFYKFVKRDWYRNDFFYLKNNKDHIFWTKFQHITDFPEYLSFFPNGYTLIQIRNITNFYQTNTIPDDHEFIYVTPEEVDAFVENTVRKVKELLTNRLHMQLVP